MSDWDRLEYIRGTLMRLDTEVASSLWSEEGEKINVARYWAPEPIEDEKTKTKRRKSKRL